MKQMLREPIVYVVTLFCLSMLVCCKKSSSGSGVGLYSTKQYHEYDILSVTDTAKVSDKTISIVSMNNNYLLWNGVTFHINTLANDTLVSYINDTSENGVYKILYTLNYYPARDSVEVYDQNPTTKFWRSYK